MNTPTKIRFCLYDLKGPRESATQILAIIGNNIADQVSSLLPDENVGIRYINILDADPESRNYNPDGLIGEFEVSVDPHGPDGHTFGYAIEALKRGHRVSREGWNGKGMFLFLLPAQDGIPTKVIHDPALRSVIEDQTGGDTFDALGSIRMFTADKKILTGWLASQSDILAEDWTVLP
jgi:hypothetical protein